MSQAASTEQQQFLRGFLFALLAVILWSGNFVVARGLHHRISPVTLSFLRWATATVFLFPLVYKKLSHEWRNLLPHLWYLCVTALAGVSIFNTLVYVAGRYTTAINLALIGTTASPVFVFLISATVLKQSLSRFQYLGITLCLAGILLLLSKGSWQQLRSFHFTAGDWWILGAALSFAIYTLLVRKKPPELSPTVYLFSLFFLGTMFLFPAFVIDRSLSADIQWNGPLIGSLLYLGIGASVLAFLFWNLSIRTIGAAKTALFGNLIPVFSSIEAALILGETFSPIAIASFLIILAGILIANFYMLKGMIKKTA
jgi:drug/metabolite transporter (DMT)-like permease